MYLLKLFLLWLCRCCYINHSHEKYINEHKDVEAYRQYLLTLKTEALERCKKEAINERKTLLEENYKVKRLIKEAKGKKRKKN